MNDTRIPCGISNRHIHVSKEDLAILFGDEYCLSPKKDLSQTGQFACEETVKLVSAKGQIENVRILGPERSSTQVEISVTDSFSLGIRPPFRESGDIAGTPGVLILGPNGFKFIPEGVIIPLRHIHMDPKTAEKLDVKDKQIVSVETEGPRSVLFNNVMIRIREDFTLDFHIDTDEANAAGLNNSSFVRILR
ncbi:MAG: phosphate propanoyltransferase [Caldisericia bacterium]|nr:phosphate propanoyltransferase [Caldisericia bacterium]